MAPAVFDGAPVVHEHLDADGNVVGYTRVVSPWTDESRAEAEALYEAEQLFCSCGNLREVCGDLDRASEWLPQRHICYASMTQGAADRKYAALHEKAPYHDGRFKRWSEKPGPGAPFHFRDGVKVWAAMHDHNPDDKFL